MVERENKSKKIRKGKLESKLREKSFPLKCVVINDVHYAQKMKRLFKYILF